MTMCATPWPVYLPPTGRTFERPLTRAGACFCRLGFSGQVSSRASALSAQPWKTWPGRSVSSSASQPALSPAEELVDFGDFLLITFEGSWLPAWCSDSSRTGPPRLSTRTNPDTRTAGMLTLAHAAKKENQERGDAPDPLKVTNVHSSQGTDQVSQKRLIARTIPVQCVRLTLPNRLASCPSVSSLRNTASAALRAAVASRDLVFMGGEGGQTSAFSRFGTLKKSSVRPSSAPPHRIPQARSGDRGGPPPGQAVSCRAWWPRTRKAHPQRCRPTASASNLRPASLSKFLVCQSRSRGFLDFWPTTEFFTTASLK